MGPSERRLFSRQRARPSRLKTAEWTQGARRGVARLLRSAADLLEPGLPVSREVFADGTGLYRIDMPNQGKLLLSPDTSEDQAKKIARELAWQLRIAGNS